MAVIHQDARTQGREGTGTQPCLESRALTRFSHYKLRDPDEVPSLLGPRKMELLSLQVRLGEIRRLWLSDRGRWQPQDLGQGHSKGI